MKNTIKDKTLYNFNNGAFTGTIEGFLSAIKKACKKNIKPIKVKGELSLWSRWGEMLEQSMKSHLSKAPIESASGKVNKGFAGTSLPLFPDIRKIEIILGKPSRFLSLFGITKQEGRTATILKGPNSRSNRYLRVQYTRLIKSIGGSFRKNKSPNKGVYVHWNVVFRKLKLEKTSRKVRKNASKRCRIYWGIALQLIRRSHVFRMAVLMKVCGKVNRWFHRDLSFDELKEISQTYLDIVKVLDSQIPVRRSWIPAKVVDGEIVKYRPLGIAPLGWRVYTRAQANILETFLANGWPTNQHAYTTGRGVSTAWKVILTKILNARNIFEFDFIGFFNTVKLEAVGTQLFNYGVPKYIVIHYLNLSSSDITNVGVEKMMAMLGSDADNSVFGKAWRKYEYIHKFRKGWRSVGLAQGFSLSPILSVLPLIVLDELEKVGVYSLIYADDGLFYGDADGDYPLMAQKILDKYGVGARICPNKSRWVKRNDVWLHPLKFVGLVYEADKDLLSASTRKGATLSLKVDILGVFADQTRIEMMRNDLLPKSILPPIDSNLDAVSEIQQLFSFYLEEQAVIDENVFNTSFHILNISNNNNNNSIVKAMRLSLLQIFSFVTPKSELDCYMKALCEGEKEDIEADYSYNRNMARWYYEIVKRNIRFNEMIASPSRWARMVSRYDWVNNFIKPISPDFVESYLEDPYHSDVYSELFSDNEVSTSNSDPILDLLVWFKKLPETPSIFPKKGLDLGSWGNVALSDIDNSSLSEQEKEFLEAYKLSIGITQLSWRNLADNKLLSTLIARLFSDSFSTDVIEQNFSMSHAPDRNTIMRQIYKRYGKQFFSRIFMLDGETNSISVFNSTSIASHIGVRLLKLWSKNNKLKWATDLRERATKSVLSKLQSRRADYNNITNEGFKKSLNFYRSRMLKPGSIAAFKLLKKLVDYPVEPYVLGDSSLSHKAHAKKRAMSLSSLSKETITRSVYSEHELRVKLYGNELNSKFSGVSWFTLAPYPKGPRR